MRDFCFSNDELDKMLFGHIQDIKYDNQVEGVDYLKSGLDFTDAKYIDYIVTEVGIYTPGEAADAVSQCY